VGPRTSEVDSTFTRFVAGIKGAVAGWDIDSALLYSQNKVSNDQGGYLQRDVAFALLNPTAANVAAASLNPAYAALPAGSLWRIAENAASIRPRYTRRCRRASRTMPRRISRRSTSRPTAR
jgi:iron complex outermembrane receptor protein